MLSGVKIHMCIIYLILLLFYSFFTRGPRQVLQRIEKVLL